jgi:hypothetical protein
MRHPSVVGSLTLALTGLLSSSAMAGDAQAAGPVLEIRCYNLKPGTRAAFHEMAVREAVPMLKRFKIDVVAHGPSLHDPNAYFLMRAFPSLEERERAEEAFYSSDEWLKGPRAAVLAAIESFATVVVPTDDAMLRVLRRTN